MRNGLLGQFVHDDDADAAIARVKRVLLDQRHRSGQAHHPQHLVFTGTGGEQRWRGRLTAPNCCAFTHWRNARVDDPVDVATSTQVALKSRPVKPALFRHVRAVALILEMPSQVR